MHWTRDVCSAKQQHIRAFPESPTPMRLQNQQNIETAEENRKRIEKESKPGSVLHPCRLGDGVFFYCWLISRFAFVCSYFYFLVLYWLRELPEGCISGKDGAWFCNKDYHSLHFDPTPGVYHGIHDCFHGILRKFTIRTVELQHGCCILRHPAILWGPQPKYLMSK